MYLTSGGVPGGDIFCDSQKRDDKVCYTFKSGECKKVDLPYDES
ncbi:MAG: hypothetical protein ACI8TE_001465 [Francisella sp.]|jgi:hypothetical protein